MEIGYHLSSEEHGGARRGAMVMGHDTGTYAEMIAAYREAGFDRLHLHQVGPDQQGFLDAWRHELRDAV